MEWKPESETDENETFALRRVDTYDAIGARPVIRQGGGIVGIENE